MGTYQQIVDILREALADAGGNKTALQKRLGTSGRSTFLKAVDAHAPVLSGPEILCPWLDTLDVEVRFRQAPEIPGCVFVRMATVEDLASDARPDRGQTVVHANLLGGRPAEGCVVMTPQLDMSPTVLPGALLLLDISEDARSEVQEGELHLVLLRDCPVLRRIQRAHAGWILVSDTPGIVPVDVPDNDLVVLGRVIAVMQPL